MNRSRALCVATVLLSCLVASHASFFSPTYHVLVENRLSFNKHLRVHCKSKDDDLGLHELRIGEAYGFKFHVNLFESTLFWCNLWQGPRYEHHQAFKVFYKSFRFNDRLCGGRTCKWVAKEDGVYVVNEITGTSTLMHEWDVCRPGDHP